MNIIKIAITFLIITGFERSSLRIFGKYLDRNIVNMKTNIGENAPIIETNDTDPIEIA